MKRHIAGKTVRGAVALELPVPDIRVIREAAQVSQSQFAKLIGVNCAPCKTGNSTAPAPPGQPGRFSKSWRPTPSHRGAACVMTRTRGFWRQRNRYWRVTLLNL